MAGALQVEQCCRVVGILKDVRGGLVDRHRSRASRGIRTLAGMQAQRFKGRRLGCGHRASDLMTLWDRVLPRRELGGLWSGLNWRQQPGYISDDDGKDHPCYHPEALPHRIDRKPTEHCKR